MSRKWRFRAGYIACIVGLLGLEAIGLADPRPDDTLTSGVWALFDAYGLWVKIPLGVFLAWLPIHWFTRKI